MRARHTHQSLASEPDLKAPAAATAGPDPPGTGRVPRGSSGSVISLEAVRLEKWEAELVAAERAEDERTEIRSELAELYRERDRLTAMEPVWEGSIDQPGSRRWTLARVNEEIARLEGMLA